MSHTEHDPHPPESRALARRVAAALTAPIQRMLAIEAASGVVLLVATVVALIGANLFGRDYGELWHTPIGGRIGPWSFEQPLHFWVNDGLMTLFFFVVGLEIRREIFEGELSTLRKAALPLVAALGGMLVPALIFVTLNAGREGTAGWAIPMATDIAFAVGVLTLLGARVAPSLRVFLLALAVIDDIGSILVIAVFYSSGISVAGFGLISIGLLATLAMRAAGVRTPLLYFAPGIVVWAGFIVTGIHPTIAGVVLGLITPPRTWFGPIGFVAATKEQLERLSPDDGHALHASLARINEARREAVSPVDRLIHALHPWVAFVIMPIFALANAGVPVGGARFSGDSLWLFLGIVLGLVVGKPLGISAASLLATKLGLATRSKDTTARGIVLVGLVGGIGFTMALFIAQLAFEPGPLLDTAKLAILVGSAIAIVVGLVFGALGRPAPPPT